MKRLDGSNNKPVPMKNLAILRKKLGKTQVNLSVLLGFSQELISKYERGLANPSIQSLKKMANFFNCSIDYLVDFSDNPFPNNNLTNEESNILIKYNRLSSNDRLRLEGYMDNLLDKNNR